MGMPLMLSSSINIKRVEIISISSNNTKGEPGLMQKQFQTGMEGENSFKESYLYTYSTHSDLRGIGLILDLECEVGQVEEFSGVAKLPYARHNESAFIYPNRITSDRTRSGPVPPSSYAARDGGSSGSGSGRGGATKERQESNVGRLLIVQEQILRRPKCAVHGHYRQSDEQSRNKNGSHAGEEHHNYRRHHQEPENLAIREGPSENHDGLVRRSEDVEEEPRAEEGEEDEQGEGVGEEGEGEDGGKQGHVVDAKVGEVLSNPGGGLGHGVGPGEGRSVDELQPGAALGEAVADGLGEA
ncbi:hypothetical protein RJ639_003180 [Escallonia herrerae]|uniref:Uncharacterized protein n=1 Tax=Escallonia herrerae TaxID=1293975 RepID=A0AA88W4Y9_9ASTE|nr:hypothetical protein RJ639_003180 [Escallonia herrerae]